MKKYAVLFLAAFMTLLLVCPKLIESGNDDENQRPSPVLEGKTTYMVTFNADGESPAEQTRTVESSGTVSSMPSEPKRSGYTFGGWYTERNGDGDEFTNFTAVTADITFYARWNPCAPVQITLQAQPGDPPLSNTIISVDQETQFSTVGSGTEYLSWQWYWEGMQISGENLDTYTLAANSQPSGVYELSVRVIVDRGATLSAQCRVAIKGRSNSYAVTVTFRMNNGTEDV
jgi:uncharacterized repeat protein (TIGR02543 family)